MSTPQEREAFVKTVGRSEIEDALNAIESGCKLTRGLNSFPHHLAGFLVGGDDLRRQPSAGDD
jgi:hypothetical protein